MKAQNACPSPVLLTRSYFEGTGGKVDEHIDRCDHCRAEMASMDRLVQLGKQLPDGRPSVIRVNAVYNALVEAASTPDPSKAPAPRRGWILAAAAAAALLMLGIYFTVGTSEPASVQAPQKPDRRARVHAHKGAEPVFLGAQPDEIVRLADGTITVEVEPLARGERFRVITGDAEVEVRGTSFDVKAKDDRLIAVNVMSGKVEVRLQDQTPVVLETGERWTRPEPAPVVQIDDPVDESDRAEDAEDPIEESGAAQAIAEPEIKRTMPVRGFKKPRTSKPIQIPEPKSERKPATKPEQDDNDPRQPLEPRRAGPAEIAFTAGWEALVNGDPAEAAAHFDEAVSKGGAAPIAEDASFWRAVANDRRGAKQRAASQLDAFLRKYPRSARSGEAACMLGWKLLDSGDLDRAEALFQKASEDRVPRIRKSAQKGLAEIKNRR